MALTTDQKRAAGIGAVGIGGFLLWRRLHSGGTVPGSTILTNATAQGASGSVTPYTPQSPVTVAAGESVYDPNDEALINTPTAYPTQAASAATPGYTVNVNYPKAVGTSTSAKKAAKRTTPLSKLTKGGTAAPVSSTKPKAPKGEHTVGLGGGDWEFLKNATKTPAKAKAKSGGGEKEDAGSDSGGDG